MEEKKNDAILALHNIYSNWVPKEKFLHTNIWSSELAKVKSNAFLAQKISSINSIGAICEATGADVREVARAIGSDTRIGSKFLDAGPGFGGSCFKKDILNLVYLSKYYGLDEVASFWEGVVKLNHWHQKRLSILVVEQLFGSVSNKKIGILGFSFKANTNDTRESAAISICKDLIDEGAILHIHDPKVIENQISRDLGVSSSNSNRKNSVNNQIQNSGHWVFASNIDEIFPDADAILILTEWEEYTNIDWEIISIKMRRPAWIFMRDQY